MRQPASTLTTLLAAAALAFPALANPAPVESTDWRASVVAQVTQQQDIDDANALQIGQWAELGYQEVKSSNLLQSRLKQAGFTITPGVAGMPTAFMATYGTDGPTIGFLAEFDALAGLSQAGTAEHNPVPGQPNGHGCGHNLLGTGVVLAAIAARNWLEDNGVAARLIVYGTPAEEGGGGKVYFARAGLFDGVDAVMNWHPDSYNGSVTQSNLAMIAGKFTFHGRSAHASAFPDKGRSALDGVEAMNMMINMMREHIAEKSRIHYAITRTNKAPNVIPALAEVLYYVRNPDAPETLDLWHRVVDAAKGAALGTGTTVTYEVLSGHYNYLPNMRLAQISYDNLVYAGGVTYDARETTFAAKLTESFPQTPPPMDQAAAIRPFDPHPIDTWTGSSDVGDVSWLTPTNWVRTATYVPGTAAHSWQAVAAANMSIGLKGMHVAAKTLALTAVELIRSPELLAEIREEFDQTRGPDYVYTPLIGDRAPPLDYME